MCVRVLCVCLSECVRELCVCFVCVCVCSCVGVNVSVCLCDLGAIVCVLCGCV